MMSLRQMHHEHIQGAKSRGIGSKHCAAKDAAKGAPSAGIFFVAVVLVVGGGGARPRDVAFGEKRPSISDARHGVDVPRWVTGPGRAPALDAVHATRVGAFVAFPVRAIAKVPRGARDEAEDLVHVGHAVLLQFPGAFAEAEVLVLGGGEVQLREAYGRNGWGPLAGSVGRSSGGNRPGTRQVEADSRVRFELGIVVGSGADKREAGMSALFGPASGSRVLPNYRLLRSRGRCCRLSHGHCRAARHGNVTPRINLGVFGAGNARYGEFLGRGRG